MSAARLSVDAELEKLQRESFGYFLHETNPVNGLFQKNRSVASVRSTAASRAMNPRATPTG